MIYKFDLTADDYTAASLSSNTTRRVVRAYLPYALVLALAFWILLRHGVAASLVTSTAGAGVLFAGVLAYHGLTWRTSFGSAVRRYHEGPVRAILGLHTLELTDAGLNSSGPLHRTFRAWPSITAAAVSRSHVFFHTLFGIVYVLPLRAVEDVEGLLTTLKGKYGVSVLGGSGCFPSAGNVQLPRKPSSRA